jgi:hypothetical protein
MRRVVRRLPVVQAPETEDAEAERRPPLAWVLIGGALVAALFLPSSAVGLWLGARLRNAVAVSEALGSLLGAAPIIAAFAVSAWSGGALCGRFGLRTRGEHGLAAGALGGSFVLAPALLTRALGPWSVAFGALIVLVGGGALFAWLGARYGMRRRPGA